MESTLGPHAVGGDAVERFFVCIGEQGVDAFCIGECGFEAIGVLDVPGGEEELGEDGELDGGVGAELVLIGSSECCEFLVVSFGEQNGLLA